MLIFIMVICKQVFRLEIKQMLLQTKESYAFKLLVELPELLLSLGIWSHIINHKRENVSNKVKHSTVNLFFPETG